MVWKNKGYFVHAVAMFAMAQVMWNWLYLWYFVIALYL